MAQGRRREGLGPIHNELTRTVVDLQSRFAAGQVALSVRTMQFLEDWLVNHILGADQKYAPFLSAKAVRQAQENSRSSENRSSLQV